jgi:hypothetical protein
MFLLVALAACGKGAGERPAVVLATNAVAEANAAVPDLLKDKLTFVAGAFEDGAPNNALAVLPAGWEKSEVIPGKYKPPSASGLGFLTVFQIGSNCDGACEAKDWATVVDRVEFTQSADGLTIEKDDRASGSRIVVATSGSGKSIRAAFWKEGASRYYVCSAILDSEATSAAPAFEKACRATTPVW